MISTVTIGRGRKAHTASIPCHHSRDVHRSLRQDAADMLKDYIFGPASNNRSRSKAYGRGKRAMEVN